LQRSVDVSTRRAHDLEIDQDLTYLRRSWRVQRAGWLAMAVVLALALAGLLGSGPLSRREVGVPGLLQVEYERFARYEAPQTLTVRVDPAATHTGEIRLWVDRRYLEHARIETITPEPSRVESAADRLVYVFAMNRPGEPATIAFGLQAERIGRISGRVGLEDAEAAAPFRQLVYP
jgi:hypothetical protein